MHSLREFLQRCLPHSKALLEKALKRKSFQFNEQKFLQKHGTIMVPPNTVPNEPNQDQILDRFAKLESRFVSLIVFVINRLFDL